PSRRELANAVRALSMDAVQKAKSGHPGMPMGMADIAEVLWNDFLKHNPKNPAWADRDRFVVSNGHGSMLLYSLLHLAGYDLSIGEIRNFRQLHSRTPGHPEFGCAPGVETTTGPLGQGLANAVGMAIAERTLAAQFNRDDSEIVDHKTYVLVGDGCLMEGISHEACSLAGTLGLGKLIGFYDDNNISIDGEVEGWFSDDTPRRFEAYGWQVIPDVDGHDPHAIATAIEDAIGEVQRPSLICCKTIIGWGAPNKQGTAATHGAPLGEDEVAAARERLSWPYAPFEVPAEIYDSWDATARGGQREAEWRERFAAYQKSHPDLARELERRMSGELSAGWQAAAVAYIKEANDKAESIATRKASLNALNGLGPSLPELIGGSADLTGSNLTYWSGSTDIKGDDPAGNYIYFGVREFGMSAIMNGIALHGGFIPYGATFLTFSDYARNALRVAALMKVRSVFVYTHDSIGLGEDGPTHQSIEHLASLRAMPNLTVWRPCDTVESAIAWKAAVEHKSGPTCLVFTRQSVPHQSRNGEQIANIARGGYVLHDCDGEPQAIIIATGSEVGIAMQAAQRLVANGRRVRVVSMPSVEVFDRQDEAYRESVLPARVTARISVEAGVSDYWRRFVGLDGKVVGIDCYGESAPGGELMKHFGFTADNVAGAVEALL
ncbi:MAG: transketolase, partial [Gammaproteobacteria bacterium]